MTILEHLDELRSRLIRVAVVLLVLIGACWGASGRILDFLLVPIEKHLTTGGEIVYITPVEPFMTYVTASFLAAVFVAMPYVLYEVWAFVAPGLYRHERRMVVPFLLVGTLFFVGGGAFGYYVAVPVASGWLIGLGERFTAQITLRSAFQFETRVILAMGLVFELPILILLLSRIGIVTPGFLLRQFRIAVLVIAVLAAVLTPTGDILTMTVFAGPMIALYLLGIAVSWLFGSGPGTRGDP
jgi:sec-independent protein translocase protein TatC